MSHGVPGGISIERDYELGSLILTDAPTGVRLAWSLESGLLASARMGGEEALHIHEEAPFQIAVETENLPIFRGRHLGKNPFLPPPLLVSCDVGLSEAQLTVLHTTVVPLLPNSPAATLRIRHSYSRSAGYACDAEAWIDAPIRNLDLRITLALSPSHDPVVTPDGNLHSHVTGPRHELVAFGQAKVELGFSLGSRATTSPDRLTPHELGPSHSPVLRTYGEMLLASQDLHGRRIAGYNVVEPQINHYYSPDRDDVVAEMVATACRFYQRCGRQPFLDLAKELAADLLSRQQPDGGLTFATRVNGSGVDYSDSDADGIDGLLTLYTCTGDEQYLEAARRLLRALLRFQDGQGFFWGRLERPDTYLYPEQPWFTAYSVVAMQQMVPYLGHTGDLEERIEHAVRWLLEAQTETGAWRYDRTGFYADYDDLTNTGVALWALARIDRSRGTREFAEAIIRGLDYMLQREVEQTGQFTGAFTPGVEKLVYDYKVGYALRELQAWLPSVDRVRASQVRQAYIRYLRHLAAIQGRGGMIRGMWGSVFDVATQEYRLAYQWHEHESSWQHYAFFGWQGKLVELFLEPRLRDKVTP